MGQTRKMSESLTNVERLKIDLLKKKMTQANSKIGVLYYEFRIHLILNKVKHRIK